MALDLSTQELEHLELRKSGHTNREIAFRLKLSDTQVAGSWQALFEKITEASCETIEDHRLVAIANECCRRQLESELWASEARLNALMDLSPEAVFVVNGRSGTILKANNQASILLGYAPSELLGASVEMLIDPDLQSKHVFLRQGFLNSVGKRELGYHPPIEAITKSGESIIIDVALTATMATDDVMVICRPTKLDEVAGGPEGIQSYSN